MEHLNTLSPEDRKAVDRLRDRGHAVAVFTEAELGSVCAGTVESIMVERGSTIIEELK